MPEGMVDQRTEYSDSRLQFFQGLIPLISARIGKEMDRTEVGAIAFTVNRIYQGSITPDVFLQETLGVGKDVLPRDSALQIHNCVHREKLSKIHELMADNHDNPSELEKLKAWEALAETGHNRTLDNYNTDSHYTPYIGGVSLDWVPAWLH